MRHANHIVTALKAISVAWWLTSFCGLEYAMRGEKENDLRLWLCRILIVVLIALSIAPMRWIRRSRFVYWPFFAIACGVFVWFVVDIICMVWTSGPAPDVIALVIAPIVLVVLLVGAGSLPAAFVLSHSANRQSDDLAKKAEPTSECAGLPAAHVKSKKGPISLIVAGSLLALGPLWGMLVTMAGMVRAFNAMPRTGGGSSERVASDIAVSLCWTYAGLMICPIGVGVLIGGIVWIVRMNRTRIQEGETYHS